MVKIDTLLSEGKISYIKEEELERYINFFENSFKDNLGHSKFNSETFPRWSIISGYYAMHDLTKMLLAKKFRIKVDFEVHATTIKLLRELIKNRELDILLTKAYKEFLSLANDLEEAKKERTKTQYYTGSRFLKEIYMKKAKDFSEKIVLGYISKINRLFGENGDL